MIFWQTENVTIWQRGFYLFTTFRYCTLSDYHSFFNRIHLIKEKKQKLLDYSKIHVEQFLAEKNIVG